MPSSWPAVPRLKAIVCAAAPENVTLALAPVDEATVPSLLNEIVPLPTLWSAPAVPPVSPASTP